MRVLIVDNNSALIALLSQQLSAHHYIVDRVADGETAWVYGSTYEYDLIISEWMLPKLSGIHLCERLRSHGYGVPFLLLTRKNKPADKVRGLQAGADDYVVKPFDMAELIARIQALLRRTPTESTPLLVWGDLCLDPVSGEVTHQGYPMSLTAKEYLLLELFFRYSNQIFSAKTLLDRVWSSEKFPSEATVRSHIRGLRQKLKAVGASPDLIETVHGMGYRLKGHSIRPLNDSAYPLPPLTESARETARETTRETTRERQFHHYLEGITQAWEAHRAESMAQWQYLSHLAEDLQDQASPQGARSALDAEQVNHLLSEQHQQQAYQVANRLAGTLGTFGLIEGYRLALEIKTHLQRRGGFSASQAAQFHTLVTTLGHAMDEPPQLAYPAAETLLPPSILLVDISNAPYSHQVEALASAQGFTTTVAYSIEALTQTGYLSAPMDEHIDEPLPSSVPSPFDIVIMNFTSGEAGLVPDDTTQQKLLQVTTTLNRQWPDLPILAIAPQADFSNRLELIRKGVTVILEYPVVPAEVIEVVLQTIARSYRLSKIMIIDDEARCIKQIIEILQPWDFQITPLSDPQQFWTVFTQVMPDLVVLDIEMPHISGLELCQVLRSSPQWQRLPIILLSDGDFPIQAQAFALGADDCINKPIQAADLAYRLLNRLKRSQV